MLALVNRRLELRHRLATQLQRCLFFSLSFHLRGVSDVHERYRAVFEALLSSLAVVSIELNIVIFEELLGARVLQQWWEQALHFLDVVLDADLRATVALRDQQLVIIADVALFGEDLSAVRMVVLLSGASVGCPAFGSQDTIIAFGHACDLLSALLFI